MTPKKQVSPAIRILRGERDASARATHLEAATRKFLVTTNERKQMSTKTNFKRIALVAVAALGLGVLSSVPSQATTSSFVLTPTNGTATTVLSDSTTAGSLTVSYLTDAAAVADSVTVTARLTADPGAGTAVPVIMIGDTTLARVDTDQVVRDFLGSNTANTGDTVTAASTITTPLFIAPSDTSAVVRVSATLKVLLLGTPVAGTYTVEFTVTPSIPSGAAKTASVSIVVAATNKLSTLGASSAWMSTGSSWASTASDSTVAVTSTASATAKAAIRVTLGNATSTASESITVTTTVGTVGTASAAGRSVKLPYTSSYLDVLVYADGTAGTATITISTPTITFPTKTVTFYSTTAAKITAVSYSSVIGASGIGVYGLEYDSSNNSFGAGVDIYAYSSDTAVISSYGSACTYNSTLKAALCTLTGVKNGTANITLRDASTVALSTVASSAVAVKVNLNSAATVALAFDKTSYAPGEKATVKITVKDSDGAILPAASYANLFATGGITTSSSLTAVSSTVLSSVAVVTMANVAASTDTPIVTTDPIGQVTVYMPVAGGTVTLSAKGGTSLPVAGQVAVSATASVTDSGAAALAAVTALATTVASLKTLITTLTNLVLKIQKKVKA
jgi:hypothetical protein